MAIQLIPIIMLDGNAMDAIRFYEKSLGAKTVFLQTYGEGPEEPERPLPNEVKERVSHSVLKVGEAELYVADTFPGQSNSASNHVQVCINTPDVHTSEKLFSALQEGGQVVLPLQPMYFSPAFGQVKDQFHVTFQIFTESQ